MAKNQSTTPLIPLAVDVPNGGTFTLPYPAGETQGTVNLATGHKLARDSGSIYTSGFTVSFGASVITITNVSLGTLPRGTRMMLEVALPPVSDTPEFVRDTNGTITSITDGSSSLPVVAKPAEVLSSSAVAASCASTAVDEVLASFTIPAGTLGANSILQIEPLWTFTSSVNNKILKVKIASATVYTATRTTSVKEGPLVVLANRNSLSSQIQPYDNTYVTAGSGAPATYAIDFSVPVTIQITGQRANAGDTLTLEYFRVLHFVGD